MYANPNFGRIAGVWQALNRETVQSPERAGFRRHAREFGAQARCREIHEGADLGHRHPAVRDEQMHRQRRSVWFTDDAITAWDNTPLPVWNQGDIRVRCAFRLTMDLQSSRVLGCGVIPKELKHERSVAIPGAD